jgi:hypothetical protein
MDQGSGGVLTVTTISAYTSATQVTLATTAQATETGVTFMVGRGPQVYFDGNTTNVANSVLTSATAAFTASDVGTVVDMFSAAVNPQTITPFTVQSFTNATTVVLSGNAGALTTVPFIINRSRAQQIRGINNGSGVCVARNNTTIGQPMLLNGGGTVLGTF